MGHGKSASDQHPYGLRSKANGKVLAPRSLRRGKKRYITDFSKAEVCRVFGVTDDCYDAVAEVNNANT